MLNNNSKNHSNNAQEDVNIASSCVLRKCCACGKTIDRNEMIRILHEHKSGQIIINPNSKQFGRSVYVCRNIECIKIARKRKRLKALSDEQILLLEKNVD